MSNEHLLRALDWTPNAIKRTQAIDRAKSHQGGYRECGFCGEKPGYPLVSGPICGICRKCAVLVDGMYLISLRDGLDIGKDHKQIWHAALSTYGHEL